MSFEKNTLPATVAPLCTVPNALIGADGLAYPYTSLKEETIFAISPIVTNATVTPIIWATNAQEIGPTISMTIQNVHPCRRMLVEIGYYMGIGIENPVFSGSKTGFSIAASNTIEISSPGSPLNAFGAIPNTLGFGRIQIQAVPYDPGATASLVRNFAEPKQYVFLPPLSGPLVILGRPILNIRDGGLLATIIASLQMVVNGRTV